MLEEDEACRVKVGFDGRIVGMENLWVRDVEA